MISGAAADRDWESNWLALAHGGVFDRSAGSRVCGVSFRVLPEFPFVAQVAF
jgi:hypothetical protein